MNEEDGGQHVVHLCNNIQELAAQSLRADMSNEVFEKLLSAIEQGIADPDNLVTNRIELVKLLSDAAQHLNKVQAGRIAATLLPLADGQIKANLDEMSEEEVEHPLSRYRAKGGSVHDLQAVSLVAISEIEKSQATGLHRKIGNLIQNAMSSNSLRVRCFAFRAWAVHPRLARDARLQVLMATSGPDKQIAAEAFAAVTEAEECEFSRKEWRALVQQCRLVATSTDRDLCWSAARCLSKIGATLQSGMARKEADRVLEQLRNDLCYSVRSAATESVCELSDSD